MAPKGLNNFQPRASEAPPWDSERRKTPATRLDAQNLSMLSRRRMRFQTLSLQHPSPDRRSLGGVDWRRWTSLTILIRNTIIASNDLTRGDGGNSRHTFSIGAKTGFDMTKPNGKLEPKKPKSVFTKPLKADIKSLFKALSKVAGHTATGNWEELGADTVEALSAIGLATDPEEMLFLLIRRSLTPALFGLVGESFGQQLAGVEKDYDSLLEQLDFPKLATEVRIDGKFFDRPEDLPLLKEIQSLLKQWLEGLEVNAAAAEAAVGRLPGYFVCALNREWRRNAKSYQPLIEALDTPFTRADERGVAWNAYSALLQRRIDEGVFGEPFSLSQIYVPLNASYLEEEKDGKKSEKTMRGAREFRRVVVSLHEELETWLKKSGRHDAIRVLSGGPGSGKSSFARVFAAHVSRQPDVKVLYVPLHQIDPANDLVDELGRFVRDEDILIENPLDPDFREPNLLIIFDGLDELASQGKAAAETARAFVGVVEKTVEKRNLSEAKLRVLISGRELVVQENKPEFCKPGQILTLLPYYVPGPEEEGKPIVHDDEEYNDPNGLLKLDLRQTWWEKYGALTGKAYLGLPEELEREDLTEITAQPLLNYLLALSYVREELDFTKDINLNSIYDDLVKAVYERGYENHRRYEPIRHMDFKDFFRILEEIGLAAWHGDGRTTTVREIEEHCAASRLEKLLQEFHKGTKTGVTRLLAAFYFRQYGQREKSGDKTFVFTHKSFGEYLAARRIVRAIERVVRETEKWKEDPDEGWDEKEALRHWVMICGPSAISPYLRAFLLNEIKLVCTKELEQWQTCLAELFSYVLKNSVPMELAGVTPFKKMLFQSRNAEEALLVALNACARATKKISEIVHPDHTAFGVWFRRIQGQTAGSESTLAAHCLTFLNLEEANVDGVDFYDADLSFSKMKNLSAVYACFADTTLNDVDLRDAELAAAVFEGSNLRRANLAGADLFRANLENANLRGANLQGTHLEVAFLHRAKLQEAFLEDASLLETNLENADLRGANLENANLVGANLGYADLRRSNLEDANLGDANLTRANLRNADLTGANLQGADLDGAELPEGFEVPTK